MVLHFWLIPAILIFSAVLWVLYHVINHTGGAGLRTDGRTVLHKHMDEEDPPST